MQKKIKHYFPKFRVVPQKSRVRQFELLKKEHGIDIDELMREVKNESFVVNSKVMDDLNKIRDAFLGKRSDKSRVEPTAKELVEWIGKKMPISEIDDNTIKLLKSYFFYAVLDELTGAEPVQLDVDGVGSREFLKKELFSKLFFDVNKRRSSHNLPEADEDDLLKKFNEFIYDPSSVDYSDPYMQELADSLSRLVLRLYFNRAAHFDE